MKGLIIIFILLSITIGCQVTDKNEDRTITSDMLENPTSIEFEDPEHNFGEISLGSSVDFSFKFKNTGESPLILKIFIASFLPFIWLMIYGSQYLQRQVCCLAARRQYTKNDGLQVLVVLHRSTIKRFYGNYGNRWQTSSIVLTRI